MPDCANVLVKVVVIFGVINRVPAHNVFCYFAVAQILTPSENLAFGSKSGFKNNVGLAPGSDFKARPFYNFMWVCMQGATRGH